MKVRLELDQPPYSFGSFGMYAGRKNYTFGSSGTVADRCGCVIADYDGLSERSRFYPSFHDSPGSEGERPLTDNDRDCVYAAEAYIQLTGSHEGFTWEFDL